MSSLMCLRRPRGASLKRPLSIMVPLNKAGVCSDIPQESRAVPTQRALQPFTSSTAGIPQPRAVSGDPSWAGHSRHIHSAAAARTTPAAERDSQTQAKHPSSLAPLPQQRQQRGGGGPRLLYATVGANTMHHDDITATRSTSSQRTTAVSENSTAARFSSPRRSSSSEMPSSTSGGNGNTNLRQGLPQRSPYSSLAEEHSPGDSTDIESASLEGSRDALETATRNVGSSSNFAKRRDTCAVWREEDEVLLVSLASQQETPLSLLDIHAFGKSTNAAARIAQARFLHREVPIRFARRVLELRNLPYGLSDTAPVYEAAGWYAGIVRQLLDCPVPEGLEGEERFAEFLSSLLHTNTCVPQALSRGVLELQKKKEVGVVQRHRIDRILDNFFTSRISLRFLVDSYISSKKNKPGFSGVIESECSPVLVAWKAAADVDRQCRVHMGTAPAIEVYGREQDTFTAVPSHLCYIIREVLKNSCRATVEHGKKTKPGEKLPPVKVIVARGKEDMTIKIEDQGGGIRRSDLQHVWSYMYSTAPKPTAAQLRGVPLDHMSGMRLNEEASMPTAPGASQNTTFAFAGYGMGLPLSRLYARYLSGSLKLRPMEGYGTDAYIHLYRLKTNSEERLPTSLEETLRVMADDGRVHVAKTRSWKTPPTDDSVGRDLIRSFGGPYPNPPI